MNAYEYDPVTKEYTGEYDQARIDPLETELQGEDVFLCPANATLIQPPQTGANEIAVFDEDADEWTVEVDLRGQKYWGRYGDENEITEIGEIPPEGPDYSLEPPPEELYYPKLYYGNWVERYPMYLNDRGQLKPCKNKAKVDDFTARRIRVAGVGEEKAKTLKMLAGENPCPEWDEWLALRNTLVADGNQFIIDNDLQ